MTFLCTLYEIFTPVVVESRVAGIHAAQQYKGAMREIAAVIGFVVLIGLLILKMIEGERAESGCASAESATP
jgi:hypothetical protein